MVTRTATAFVYPLGFIIYIFSGAQIFTEHTASASHPVLDRKATATQLLRKRAIVIVGNLIAASFRGILLWDEKSLTLS